jgi:hypothetical protein
MIVLISLTKWSAETHWTKALGDEASILIDVTRKGHNQVWQIVAGIRGWQHSGLAGLFPWFIVRGQLGSVHW